MCWLDTQTRNLLKEKQLDAAAPIPSTASFHHSCFIYGAIFDHCGSQNNEQFL